MALPIDSSHLTMLRIEEMVPVFTGAVESRFADLSVAQAMWPSRTVTGTNSFFSRYFGKTKLQAITPGVRPPANPTTMTKRLVVVDTVVLARNNVDLLNDIQADFSTMSEISLDQGKEHAEFYDKTFFGQLSKGALAPAIPGIDNAIPAGINVNLGAGEEDDPDVLAESIASVITQMKKRSVPVEELKVWLNPERFQVLLNNDKLVSRDFTATGADFAMRKIFYIAGVPIIETNAIPDEATAGGTHHLLSNASNGYRYDVTAEDAKAVALIGHARSLMPGESINLTSKIWYNNEELQHFIDSYLAFAVDWNRPDLCAAVRKA